MKGIGLRNVQVVREQADNTADAVPCDRLPEIYNDEQINSRRFLKTIGQIRN